MKLSVRVSKDVLVVGQHSDESLPHAGGKLGGGLMLWLRFLEISTKSGKRVSALTLLGMFLPIRLFHLHDDAIALEDGAFAEIKLGE